MTGNEHALRLRDGLGRCRQPGVGFCQGFHRCCGAFADGGGLIRKGFSQFIPGHLRRERPLAGVSPYVRIRLTIGLDDPVLGNGRRKLIHPTPLALEPLHDLNHAAFKMQPAVENEVRLLQTLDIALPGLEQVRIDTGTHQRLHFRIVPGNSPQSVGNHRGRGNNEEFSIPFALPALRGTGAGEMEREPYKQQAASRGNELHGGRISRG